jgi:hypothetical protein
MAVEVETGKSNALHNIKRAKEALFDQVLISTTDTKHILLDI